ncbi:MAG: flavin reductase [Bacteroidota bacterium]
MENLFQKINPKQLNFNVFKILDDDWMLVTAGTPTHCNTMTASWGGFGILWNKPVAFVFIRPQRYTYLFAEKYPGLTLSFFDEHHRETLNYCGAQTGKDVDKIAHCGLTPFQTESGSVAFQQARLIFDCKKLYFQDINPAHAVDINFAKIYPHNDYHRMYVCEITQCYEKK